MQEIKEDEIDLVEVFKKIYKYKFIILGAMFIFALAGVGYVLSATPWYKASVAVEVGYYKNTNNQEVLLANPSNTIQNVKINQNLKSSDYALGAIALARGSNKLINIELLSTSNDTAKKELENIVNDILKEHQDVLNLYLEQKKFQITTIDKKINILNNKTNQKQSQIEYIKTKQIPHIDIQIAYLKDILIPQATLDVENIDSIILPALDKNIQTITKRLQSYETQLDMTKDSTLKQNLYTQISILEQNLLNLQNQKELFLTQIRPNTKDKLDNIVNVNLQNLLSQRDIIINEKLPFLQAELDSLIGNELTILLDQKSNLELLINPINYKNTQINKEITTLDAPIKPKKILLVFISAITGFLVSVFGILLFDMIKNVRARN